jgi:hypothetical protein
MFPLFFGRLILDWPGRGGTNQGMQLQQMAVYGCLFVNWRNDIGITDTFVPLKDIHQRSVPANDGPLMSIEWNVMI